MAFAVAAIPTALPAVVTAILSKGSQTLAEAGAIMKRLRSVRPRVHIRAQLREEPDVALNQMTAVGMAMSVDACDQRRPLRTTVRSARPAASPTSADQYFLPMALFADARSTTVGSWRSDRRRARRAGGKGRRRLS